MEHLNADSFTMRPVPEAENESEGDEAWKLFGFKCFNLHGRLNDA